MLLVGMLLLYLAIVKKFEPLLLLPIGFGAILANIPGAGIAEGNGILHIFYEVGIESGAFPLIIFLPPINQAPIWRQHKYWSVHQPRQ
jgi:oxaloacetate decarboxylase beta subunit